VGLRITGRREEHGVDKAEDGGVRANPQRENNDRRNGETRRLPKLPDREFKILDHMRLPVRCRHGAGWIQKSRRSISFRRTQDAKDLSPSRGADLIDQFGIVRSDRRR
jgi:hypothetical protein